jgi:hypothetical protein
MNDILAYADMPDEVLERILHDVQHALPQNPLERCDVALAMLAHVGERLDAMAGRLDAINAIYEAHPWHPVEEIIERTR